MVGLTGNSVKVQSRHETSEEAWSSIAFAQISLNFLKKNTHFQYGNTLFHTENAVSSSQTFIPAIKEIWSIP